MNLLSDTFASTILGDGPSLGVFLFTTLCTLVFGIVVGVLYALQNKRSKTIAIALVLMPTIVAAIIMLVSGNIGAGVAVAGAFNLVRFRSAPGNAKDIGYIFFAMVLGFISGMGMLLFAGIFLVVVGAMLFIVVSVVMEKSELYNLRITLPENMDFASLFDDVFAKYTTSHTLLKVRTTNMGSLFELTYHVGLKDPAQIKSLLDDIRVKNGNLNIFLSQRPEETDEL